MAVAPGGRRAHPQAGPAHTAAGPADGGEPVGTDTGRHGGSARLHETHRTPDEPLEAGDQVRFAGAIQVTVTDGSHESRPRRFLGGDGAAIRAQAGPIDVVVQSLPGLPARVCPPD